MSNTISGYDVVLVIPDGSTYDSNESIIDMALDVACPVFSQKLIIDILKTEDLETKKCFAADNQKPEINDDQFFKTFFQHCQEYN